MTYFKVFLCVLLSFVVLILIPFAIYYVFHFIDFIFGYYYDFLINFGFSETAAGLVIFFTFVASLPIFFLFPLFLYDYFDDEKIDSKHS